jgi:hypothetical protein
MSIPYSSAYAHKGCPYETGKAFAKRIMNVRACNAGPPNHKEKIKGQKAKVN